MTPWAGIMVFDSSVASPGRRGLQAEQSGSGGVLSVMHSRCSLKVIAFCYFKYVQEKKEAFTTSMLS